MRFALTEEQQGFASSLHRLLAGGEVVAAARSWAAGDPAPGQALWKRLADQGVPALVIPEHAGGLGGTPVDLVVAFEQLGRHAVPGPWVESAAYLPMLWGESEVAEHAVLTDVAGGASATVQLELHADHALDADVTAHAFRVSNDGTVSRAVGGAVHRSMDPVRRLVDLEDLQPLPRQPSASARARAFDLAALACAAQQLGLAEHLLAATVDYVKHRTQFGRPVGSYQAVKHALADVRISLDLVRPLVLGAATTFDATPADAATADPTTAPAIEHHEIAVPVHRARDVSAAKVAASEASARAARTALQLHGALGYTEEHDLSLWLLKSWALVSAWGTPAFHRRRVMTALTSSRSAAATDTGSHG